jgi:Family of unknown function (DUF6282)
MAISTKGFYDLHVHTGPVNFRRLGDALDLGRMCADAGMAGMVAKGHFEATIARAHHANKELNTPNFKVYSAIALNRGVGGINPAAVELAMDMGAKVVWLPTLDAANHARAFGGAGTYGFKEMTLNFKRPSTFDKTYTVLDNSGKLNAETKEVIDIVNAYDAILATGHISKEEIYAVAEYALGQKLKRMLVTHPEFTVPDLDLDTMVDLTKQGVYLEFCAANVFPIINKMTLAQMKDIMEAVGPEHAIISSDAGQPFHPSPPEMLRSYVGGLNQKGLSEMAIRTMCIDNPAYLLNIPLSNNPPTNARAN